MRRPKRKTVPTQKAKLSRRPRRRVATTMNEEDARRVHSRSSGLWWDKSKKLVASLTGSSLTEQIEGRGIKVPQGASMTWRRYRLAYCLQEDRRVEHGLETPAEVADRIKKLDTSEGRVPSWCIDIFTGRMPEEAGMAKKKGPKRKTIGARMVEILRLKKVPTNLAIVTMVKKDFPDSAFNSAHVSWYKGAFMKGSLPGQTKGEKINQPEIREAVAATTTKKKGGKKTAKKKVRRGPKRKARK